MSDITLSAGVRQNLLALQNQANLFNVTSERLSTGKKVNSALDNPTAYFTAAALNNRASQLSDLLDNMGNAVQTVQAANQGITSITSLVNSAKALANQALGTSDTTTRSDLSTQFDNLLTQIDQLAKDAGYNGINLLNGDNLQVYFNETNTSSVTITGVTDTTAGALSIGQAVGSWATNGNINTALTDISNALSTLQAQATTFGSSLTVVNARQSFTNALITTLQTGADGLTQADTNLESANLTALQTSQQISTASLAFANTANSNVLRLFQ